jgi:hypothetical protein
MGAMVQASTFLQKHLIPRFWQLIKVMSARSFAVVRGIQGWSFIYTSG